MTNSLRAEAERALDFAQAQVRALITAHPDYFPLVTEDGRTMPLWIPNDFLDRFCDVAERWGMAGKFSIVPAPGGLGDVVQGIEGHDPAVTREWLDTARRRLGKRWDFCSEGITHNLAVNLAGGGYFEQGENEWSQTQTRETLSRIDRELMAVERDQRKLELRRK